MSMYSGIGSFVKKYNEGGGADSLPFTEVGSGSGSVLSYEEWLQTPAGQAAADGPRGGQISGLGNPQVMYQAYLAGQGASGGGATNQQSLPGYMSIGENNQILIPPATSNKQFVQAMEMLGYFDNADPYDYEWLLKYFANDEGTWLAQRYNDADRNLDVSAIADMDFTDQNKSVFERLFGAVNTASSAGGFLASPTFLTTYGDGVSVGQPTSESTDGGSSTYTPRPLTLGPPPTGGVPGARSYSLSDVMVTASEQPNLYDTFNPYPVGGFEQINPYSTPVTTSAPYSAPTSSTPPLVVDSTSATAVTPVVDTTTTPVVDTTSTPTTSSYTPPTYTDEEIALYKYRTMTPEAFAASGYSLPTAGGVSVADIGGPSFPEGQGYQGYSSTAQGGPALDGAINPDYAAAQQGDTVGGIGNTTGMGQDINWSAPTTQALSVGDVFSTPAGDYRAVDNGYGQVGLVAEGDVAVSNSGDIIYNTSSGDHHFGVDPNTGEAWYQGAQGTTPGSYETAGFAEGGIVDVYSGDMSKLQTTGDGIESFLNPERSKATLRRNLAKLAPRPTAPVMQQGIMPMAV